MRCVEAARRGTKNPFQLLEDEGLEVTKCTKSNKQRKRPTYHLLDIAYSIDLLLEGGLDF